ncbi:DNA recombination protein RmuC [Anaeromyxobacter oryzae]|uniref:DNA recombination protein RmuC n=1 Tax=Anaeromyxobacter oryzae TaxID=2918170 RepID=A0ABM7WX83_9BACT|nr:DNA recombination protein RmuC [Anaeromyxobacter oryzae]BDG04125.1 hypothetical protein AMOR_31210 [Anaeromyxobacter oryzae]
MDPLLALAAGLAVGGAAGLALWAGAARRAAAAEALLEAERRHADARLAAERARAAEQLALVEDARARLTDAFKALSADALRESSASFLALARASLERYQEGARGELEQRERAVAALVAPVKDGLAKLDGELRALERAREGAYGALVEQLRSLAEAQGQVRAEAASLVRALRAPHVRGRWGELQLRRVVELAGMVAHCDFREQQSAESEAGRLRPDLVVSLPGGRNVVVDAKAPLAAYLEAVEAKDDQVRAARHADHARQLRDHVAALSRKAYWEQFQPAPEFVVLFLPGESFYAAALEADPSLLEAGAERRVLVATPTTLIALLKAVAYGWQKEAAQENAEAVAAVGRDLHKRLGDLGEHLARLGRSLAHTVEAYNRTVGSAEARLVPAARRLSALGAAPDGADPITLAAVEALPRPVLAPELVDGGGAGG